MSDVRIRNLVNARLDIPWREIKHFILGQSYILSIALIDEKEMRRVRRILWMRQDGRKTFSKDHALNVLSFTITDDEGEILLNIERIKTEAQAHNRKMKEHALFLYIHGLLHLKGYDHRNTEDAKTMEEEEERIWNIFS